MHLFIKYFINFSFKKSTLKCSQHLAFLKKILSLVSKRRTSPSLLFRILLGCVASGDKEVSDVDMLPVTMRPQHIDLFISRADQTGTQSGSLVYQTPSRMHECVE